MNAQQLEYRNTGHCPECGRRLIYEPQKENNKIVKFRVICGDHSFCGFSEVLTFVTIKDFDRRHILSQYMPFGYFSAVIDEWVEIFVKSLCFDNISDFILWILIQIKTNNYNSRSLDNRLYRYFYDKHNRIYYKMVNKAYHSSEGDNENLARILKSFPMPTARLINILIIENKFPDLVPASLFHENDETINQVLEFISEKVKSWEFIEQYFNSISDEDLRIGIIKTIRLYKDSKNIHIKKVIKGFYSLLIKRHSIKYISGDYDIKSLTDFLLSEADNLYFPFTTTNYSAKSFEEYLHSYQIDEKVKKSFLDDKLQHEDNISKLRSEIEKINNDILIFQSQIVAKSNLLKAKQKSSDRFNELSKYTNLNPINRLKKLLNSDKPLFYFPDGFFEDAVNCISYLTEIEKELLKDKLKTAKKGVLKELKLKLNSNNNQ